MSKSDLIHLDPATEASQHLLSSQTLVVLASPARRGLWCAFARWVGGVGCKKSDEAWDQTPGDCIYDIDLYCYIIN